NPIPSRSLLLCEAQSGPGKFPARRAPTTFRSKRRSGAGGTSPLLIPEEVLTPQIHLVAREVGKVPVDILFPGQSVGLSKTVVPAGQNRSSRCSTEGLTLPNRATWAPLDISFFQTERMETSMERMLPNPAG